MYTRGQPQVLSAKVPAYIHQLDSIERAPTPPWRRRGMGAFTFEVILDRDQTVGRSGAERHAEVVAHVAKQHHIDILKDSRADIISLRAQKLFRHARPELDRAREMLAFHHLLDCNCGDDVERHAGIVAFTVPWSAFNHRIMVCDTGFL